MNTVHVVETVLFPGGVKAVSVVERDDTGRTVTVVAVDYQYPDQDLHRMAARYAALRGLQVQS